jgi:hypothetical protein
LVVTTQQVVRVVQAVALATMEQGLVHLPVLLVTHHQQTPRKVIMVAQISHPTLHGLVAVAVVLVLLVALVLQGWLELVVLVQHRLLLAHL